MTNTVKFMAKPELKEVRKEKYTQSEMISLINVHHKTNYTRSFYANIEDSNRSISPDMAAVIARILEKNIEELFISR